jgi:putative Mn2+ efflux pump MntP
MGWLSLIALALALATDAFAVAIVTGLSLNPMTRRHVFRLSFHFGFFQALMPTLGWSMGAAVSRYLSEYDHWIAFFLLALVGTRMISGMSGGDEGKPRAKDPTSGWQLVLLSIATSVDALAVGLSLALVGSSIVVPAIVIGVVAGSLTVVGMLLGRRIGIFWGKRVEVIGGLVLVAIGVQIVIKHLTG